MRDQTLNCDLILDQRLDKDDLYGKKSMPDVMTFAILAASMFYCDDRRACLMTLHDQHFSKILSHSQ